MDNIIHYYTIQVIAILVEDCQSFRDCTSCTGLGDPFLVYNLIICVGGVYVIRSVPHPVISVEYQLIGSMLVVLVLYQ